MCSVQSIELAAQTRAWSQTTTYERHRSSDTQGTVVPQGTSMLPSRIEDNKKPPRLRLPRTSPRYRRGGYVEDSIGNTTAKSKQILVDAVLFFGVRNGIAYNPGCYESYWNQWGPSLVGYAGNGVSSWRRDVYWARIKGDNA